MGKKRIVLHCGFPKTGTSALQVQMAQGRATLLGLGYDYLRTGGFELGRRGQISSGNGVGLAQAYLPPHHESSLAPRRGEITNNFLREIRNAAGNVILSSEFFAAMPARLMAELVDILSAEGEVVLVFFTRDQLALMASTYVQRVKRHGMTDFPDAFFADWNHFKPSLTYFSFLEKIRMAAPNATILARPYEHAAQTDGGLLGLFLSLLDQPFPEDLRKLDQPINISPSPQEVRMLIEINKHRPRMEFSDMLVAASAEAGRGKLVSPIAIMPPELRKEVRAFFDEENENFFRDYAGCENLYAGEAEDVPFIDLRTLEYSVSEVMMVMAGLLTKIDRRIAALEAQRPG